MADAGLRLTVEGEKEFKAAVKDINQLLKLNQAELQKITAEYNASDKSITDLTGKQKAMGEVVDRQTAIVVQMEEELARLTEEYGENATGVVKMKTETDKAKAALANMQAQLSAVDEEAEEVNKIIRNAADGVSSFGDEAGDAGKSADDFRRANELLATAVKEYENKMETLNAEMEEAVRLYGEQSREASEYRAEIDRTTTELQNMQREMENNEGKIGDLETEAGGLSDVFGDIAGKLGIDIPDGLLNANAGIAGMATAAGAVATIVVGIAKKTKEMMDEAKAYADEIVKLSGQYSLSAGTVEELQYVAQMTGAEIGELLDVIKDLTQNMYDAANGNEELKAKFEAMSVSITDTKGNMRDAYDVFLELTSAYSEMKNETERAAAMTELFGEGAKVVNGILREGNDAISEYTKKAEEYGITLGEDVLIALDKAEQKSKEAQATFDAFIRNASASLALFREGETELAKDAGSAALKAGLNWGEYASKRYLGEDSIIAGTFETANNIYKILNGEGEDKNPVGRGTPVTAAERNIFGIPKETTTVNNYNVTIDAATVREMNDIARVTANKRVTDRMW